MAGTYRYRIESRDIDATLRVRLCSLGDLLLRAAGDDADMLGFGVGDLNADNASWVLSRMAIEMRRLPGRGEQIDIYTWVSDSGRLFTTRNMTIADGDGVEIGAAVTLWAMIDLDTRRPLDLSPLSNKSTSLVDRQPPIERPRKTGAFDGSSRRPYTVVYSDIDFNGHVNSMKYLEWMIDTVALCPDEEIIRCDGGLRLDINYLHEAGLGESLVICSGTVADTATGTPPDERTARGDRRHCFDIQNTGAVSICRAVVITY